MATGNGISAATGETGSIPADTGTGNVSFGDVAQKFIAANANAGKTTSDNGAAPTGNATVTPPVVNPATDTTSGASGSPPAETTTTGGNATDFVKNYILPKTPTETAPFTLPAADLQRQVASDKAALQAQAKAAALPIATMIAETTNAQSIASKAGNQAGVVFTTAVLGVLNTIAASGGQNSGNTIETAAVGLGKTTTEFLNLVGEGDVAAFGVVIGDLGGVLNGLQGGQPGKLLSSSMSTVGDTIKAYGISNGDKYQQFVGTVLSGTGGLLAGLNSGQTDGGLPPGLALAGGIATSLANLSGDKNVAALGTALTGASTAADYFNKSQGLLAQGTIAGTIGTVVGGLIGGVDGQKVAIGGDLVNNAFAFAANTVPGAASGNVLSLGLDALQLLGVKIDPGVTSIGSLVASALSGPVGWVSAGIQIIGSFFNMGDHNKDVTLQENINATGRIQTSATDKPTDKVSILDHTNIGFLTIGSSHSSTVQYDVSGVSIDPRLLNKIDYSITPETYTTKQLVEIGTTGRMQTPNGTATATLDDGTRISGKIVNTYPAGSEDYSDSYVAPTSTSFVAADGRQFAMVGQAMGRPGSAMQYRLVVPTGNYVAKVDATYYSINPTVGEASGSVKWVLNATDANTYIKAFGSNTGSFTGADTAKVAYAKSFTDQMSMRFRGAENDPTYIYYADVNADKIPDMISLELNMNGLERKGDGSVTVTLMDKDRKTIGQPVVSKDSSDMSANLKAAGTKVADMLKTEQLRPLLTLYAAAHPETWDGGKDYTSVYKTLSANGTITKLQEAQSLNTQLAQALVTPGGDVGGLVTKLQALISDLKLDFNPAAYAAANPDVAKAIGTDATKLAEHYIANGNAEGRSVTTDGVVLAKAVPAILRGFTSLGPSITNGQIEQGQALVSSNGQYAAKMQSDGNFVIYNTSTGAATWSSQTQKQDHTGWFFGAGSWSDPPGKRVAVQADGNLVIYADNNKARWSSDTYSTSANRAFKLTMQDDGNLVIYDSQSGPAKWVNPDSGPALWAASGGKQQNAVGNNGAAPLFQQLARKEVALGNDPTLAGSANIGSKATLAGLQYIASYSDLITAYGTDAKAGNDHQTKYAKTEGRVTSFDAQAFMDSNPDVKTLVGNDPVKAAQYYIANSLSKRAAA